MKRFVFTLQPLLQVKQTLEKKQKHELALAQEALHRQFNELVRLDAQMARNTQELERRLAEHSIADELQRYSNFLRHLTQDRAVQLEAVEQAREEVYRLQQVLLQTMREIKTLNRLREEQYARYLEELRAEEAKEIGDLISYRTTVNQ